MLEEGIGFLLELAGLDITTGIGHFLNFFIYDSVKIIALLFLMIMVMGFIRTYIPQQKIKKWLSGKKGLAHTSASLLGAITPFCSCSSIPLFLSFLEAGVPLGVTFSFLITSPLINEYLVVLMLAFFGWKITVAYIASGLLIGIFSGYILGKMNLDDMLEKNMIASRQAMMKEIAYNGIKPRLLFGIKEAISIVKKLWIWIVVAVGVGALIHNHVPQEAIHTLISKTGIFTVPIAVLVGVPIYGSCAAIVPIAVVLFEKGIPLGTTLAFMMATAALSFPEAIILRRAMKLKLIGIFFGIVTLGIIFIGFLFNILQKLLI